MKNIANPFLTNGYESPSSFCDRINETNILIRNVQNGMNTTLFSMRRMGKTGLLHHTIYQLERKRQAYGIHIDIFATQNLQDFTNQLASSILQKFPQKVGFGKQFIEFIKRLHPIISYDNLTGQPEITFDYNQTKRHETSIEQILKFLDSQKKLCVIAIDEFQQITHYPEKNVEALLRTYIQKLKNVRFIFSGSHKHLLHDLFNDVKRPFFASTQMLNLGSIDKKMYAAFILKKMLEHKKNITTEAIDYILEFTNTHTYYTQVLCNRIFATGVKKIDLNFATYHSHQILQEQEGIYYQYNKLLTNIQWQLLKAIAKDEKVYAITSKKFSSNHQVGTASNIQRATEALLNKEMIYTEQDTKGTYFQVYDCFLMRWLQLKK